MMATTPCQASGGRATLAAALLVLLTMAFAGCTPDGGDSPAPSVPVPAGSPSASAAGYQVSAWTFGDPVALARAVKAGAADEVCVDWYVSDADGGISRKHPPRPGFVRRAQAHDVRVLATFTNWDLERDTFSTPIATRILGDPERRRRHLQAIVDVCLQGGYDGVDMDWEIVRVADSRRYADFVRELGRRLHARDKLLSIAVHPKTSDEGTWFAPRAMDYRRLGAAVDEFKVMTYEFSGSWGPPGPIAPLSWTDDVLAYTVTRVPAGKVWMGVPFYGKDWLGEQTTEVRSKQARALLAQHDATVEHPHDGEAQFTYTDAQGREHTVVFQDEHALAAKLRLVTVAHPDIAGVAIWRMGDEDPAFWTTIARELGRD